MKMERRTYAVIRNIVVDECKGALETIDEQAVHKYLEMILKADRVYFVGVGRVLLALKCMAKRYTHLGVESVVVGEITEPAITKRDVLVVGSGSGETLYPTVIAEKAKEIGAGIIHIGSNPENKIRDITDLFVRIPVNGKNKKEDEFASEQPMTSLFEQSLFLFGDITSMMIIENKEINVQELWMYHANLE